MPYRIMYLANTGYVIHQLYETKGFFKVKHEWQPLDKRGYPILPGFTKVEVYKTVEAAKTAIKDFKFDGKIMYEEKYLCQ